MKRNKSWMAFALLAFAASVAVAQSRYIANSPVRGSPGSSLPTLITSESWVRGRRM